VKAEEWKVWTDYLKKFGLSEKDLRVDYEYVFPFDNEKLLRGLHIRADAVVWFDDENVVELIEVKQKLDLRALEQVKAYLFFARSREEFAGKELRMKIVCREAAKHFLTLAEREGVEVVIVGNQV